MQFPTPFGQYEIQELLGHGGMGKVYRAFDREHERVVALKLLPPDLAVDQTFAEQFLAECHAAAQLTEPHVIPVHRFGMIEGRLYIDMRLVDGEDLAQLIAREAPLSAARAVSLVRQAAQALDAAHAAGLVHRDVKPSNLLVTPHDFVCLVDFGLAQRAGATPPGQRSGLTVGTFDYMAPERFRDDGQVDARADVYALACVLFETLTGRRPFPFEPGPELMRAQLEQPPPRVTDVVPSLPPALDDVVARGMAKDPDERYPSAGRLAATAADALRTWLPAPGTGDVALEELLLTEEAAPDTVAIVRPRAPRRRGLRGRSALMAGAVGVGGLVLLGGTAALGAGLLPTDDSTSVAAAALPSTSAAAGNAAQPSSQQGTTMRKSSADQPPTTAADLAMMAVPQTTAAATAAARDIASGATTRAATTSAAPTTASSPATTPIPTSPAATDTTTPTETTTPTATTEPTDTTTPIQTTAPTDTASPTGTASPTETTSPTGSTRTSATANPTETADPNATGTGTPTSTT